MKNLAEKTKLLPIDGIAKTDILIVQVKKIILIQPKKEKKNME